MKLKAPNNPLRSAFTLVEVLAATGIFTLVLLGSFVAIGRILDAQNLAYSRTRAATLAMMISKMYMSKANASGPDPVGSILQAPTAGRDPGATDIYIGGTSNDRTTGSWYIASDWKDSSGTIINPDLQSYQDFLVFVGTPVAETASGESLKYSLVTLWTTGFREDFNGSTVAPTITGNSQYRRIRFLGRYIMPVSH